MSLTTRFDPASTTRMRHDLLARGQTVATLLGEVLAGNHPPGLTAILDAKPGKRPEEVLRETLAQVEERRRMLDAGDDHFGRCDICGVDLGATAIGEMPWADRCMQHATA